MSLLSILGIGKKANHLSSQYRNPKYSHRLSRMEPLEDRVLLAVSQVEFDAIRAEYAGLNLAADISSYNIIDIRNNTTQAELKNALNTAKTTTKNDLIVVSSGDISTTGFDISSFRGSVTIVAFDGVSGSNQLTLDGRTLNIFRITNTTVGLGGLVLKNANYGVQVDTSSSVNVYISKCEIYDNYIGISTRQGNGYLALTDSIVSNNRSGGVIARSGSIDNCLFEDNRGSAASFSGTVTVTESNFYNNRSSYSGGALSASVLTLSDSEFIGNSAVLGGAIYVTGNNSTIENCIFEGNSSSSGSGEGGAIKAAIVSISECVFYENSAPYGSAINASQLTISNCDIYDNGSNNNSSNGGGIYAGSLKMDNCNIRNNFSYYGGGIYATSIDYLINSNITENSATYSGGGLLCNGRATLIENCEFTDNLAGSDGGGASFWDASVQATIKDTLFTRNQSMFSGGGIHFNSNTGHYNLYNIEVINNTTLRYGGGIYVEASIRLEGCKINNNTVSGGIGDIVGGGGIYSIGSLYSDNSIISGNSVFNNSGTTQGGGIYHSWGTASSYTSLDLRNTQINNNTATLDNGNTKGGGLFIGGYAIAKLTDCTVKGNVADIGGGMYLASSSAATVIDYTSLSNTARTGQGSGIYKESGATLTLKKTNPSQTKVWPSSSVKYLNDGDDWFDLQSGQITMVLRDYSSTKNTAEVSNLSTLTNQRTYLDEWACFQVEVWANTKSTATGISQFSATIQFDSNVFEVDKVNNVFVAEAGNAFGTFTCTVNGNKVTITGTLKSGQSRQGDNTNTLLGRIAFIPVDKPGGGLPINMDGQYLRAYDNGFAVVANQIKVTDGRTLSSPGIIQNDVALFPVMFDFNDDGVIDDGDLAYFEQALYAGSYNNASSYIKTFYYIADNNHDGNVSFTDFSFFTVNMNRVSLQAVRQNKTLSCSYQSSFPTAWLPSTNSLSVPLMGISDDLVAQAAEQHLLSQADNVRDLALASYCDYQTSQRKNEKTFFDELAEESEWDRLLKIGAV